MDHEEGVAYKLNVLDRLLGNYKNASQMKNKFLKMYVAAGDGNLVKGRATGRASNLREDSNDYTSPKNDMYSQNNSLYGSTSSLGLNPEKASLQKYSSMKMLNYPLASVGGSIANHNPKQSI